MPLKVGGGGVGGVGKKGDEETLWASFLLSKWLNFSRQMQASNWLNELQAREPQLNLHPNQMTADLHGLEV